MNTLVSLAAWLVPSGWRPGVLDDLEDEAAGVHSRAWVCWQLMSIGVRTRLSLLGDNLRADARDAFRSLAATPFVAAVIVLSIALGIGANTALFSIVDSLALKTLPVRAPEELVLLDHGSDWWTNPIWEQIRARQNEFSNGGFAWSSTRFDLATNGPSEMIDGAYVSGRMFEVLGVAPARGRSLTEMDDVRGGGSGGPVAVVSYDFWQRHLGGSNAVVGQHIHLSRVPFTVVGVAARGFFGPEVGHAASVFVPLGSEPLIQRSESAFDNRLFWWLHIAVRTKPGQSFEAATTALRNIQPQVRAATLPQDIPSDDLAEYYLAQPFSLTPGAQGGGGAIRTHLVTPLTVMLVVVGLVLLVACANVANLILARAVARRHAFAVRLVLGSSRGTLVRQLLFESAWLAGTGGLFGLALAQAGGRLLVRQLAAPTDPMFLDLTIDWRVFAFATLVTLVTTVCFSLGPALVGTRVAPVDALQTQDRGVAGARRTGARGLLVVAQVALSLVLIVAAGLFLRTFAALVHAPLGVAPDRILLARMRAVNVAPSERPAIFARLLRAAATVPAVRRAALSTVAPLTGQAWELPIDIPCGAPAPRREMSQPNPLNGPGNGLPGVPTNGRDVSWVNGITPGWFDAYDMHIVTGRDFTAYDSAGASRVAIINEAFRREFFSGQEPIGRRIVGGMDGSGLFAKVPFEIVGVVSDARYRSIREGMVPTLYVPVAQIAAADFWARASPTLSVASFAAPSAQLTSDLTETFGRVDPRVAFTFETLDDVIGNSATEERAVAVLSGFFGGLALLLAVIGLYGLASYTVDCSRTEFGVRMALGANRRDIVRIVMGNAGRLIGAGIAIGGAVGFWAARFVASSLLFGVQPRDMRTFLIAAFVLGIAGVLAAWLPARRAGRIHPADALRLG